MNPAMRLESELIVSDQRRLHGAVADLDRRIDLLLRQIEREAEPAPVPAPEPEPETAPAAIETAPPPTPPPLPTPSSPPPLPKTAPTNDAVEPLELRLGTYWMSRVGMVILLTGLVFLGNYAYHRVIGFLGPCGKLALLMGAGVALAGTGAWLERSRETMRNFGRVLLGGGAATIYYTVYAAHFVERLRVIESPLLGGSLLLLVAGGIAWYAQRRRAEVVASVAILLSYYTSAINPIGAFTLWSNLLLTAVATYFLVRHRWSRLTVLSLAATYGSYGYWRFHQLAQFGTHTPLGAGLAFLAAYWVLFTVAVFAADETSWRGAKRAAFLSLNNGALFSYAAFHFGLQRHGEFWLFSAVFGVVLLGLAALAARRHRELPSMDGAYLAQGLLLVTLAGALRLTGPQFAVVLAVESGALMMGGRKRHGWLYQAGAALCALGAFALAFLQIQFHVAAPGALGFTVAGVLLANGIAAKFVVAERRAQTFVAATFGYAVLALVLGGWVAAEMSPAEWQPVIFALAALTALLFARIRLVEIALPVQAFALVAANMIVARCAHGTVPAWWTAAVVTGVAVALMHAWQFARASVGRGAAMTAEFVLAVTAVGTTFAWSGATWHGEEWLLVTSAGAVLSVLYGLATRTWTLAAAGQLFTAGMLAAAMTHGPESVGRWHALAPVVALGAIAALTSLLAAHRWSEVGSASAFKVLADGYRFVAATILGLWAIRYLPPTQWPAFYLLTGAALVAVGGLNRSGVRWACGILYAGVGLALIWLGSPDRTSLLDLAGILAISASSRWCARRTPSVAIPELAQAIECAVVATVWWWIHQATLALGWGNQLTVAWALSGVAVMAVGFVARSRIDRVGGLIIVALAVGRLFAVNVWQFDTLYRIVSFLALGGALLALSFVYHRFAETLRRWM